MAQGNVIKRFADDSLNLNESAFIHMYTLIWLEPHYSCYCSFKSKLSL